MHARLLAWSGVLVFLLAGVGAGKAAPQVTRSGLRFEIDLERLATSQPAGRTPLTFADAVQARRFTTVSLSPSGRWLAYQVRTGDLAANRYRTSTRLLDLDHPNAPTTPAGEREVVQVEWARDADVLYYLASEGGVQSLRVHDPGKSLDRALLQPRFSAIGYAVSPAGDAVAVIETRPTPADQTWTGVAGYTYTEEPWAGSFLRRQLAVPQNSTNEIAIYSTETGVESQRWQFDGPALDITWAPAGGMLLVRHWSGSRPESHTRFALTLLQTDSSVMKRVLDWHAYSSRPVWLPDGKRFVFSSSGDHPELHPFTRDNTENFSLFCTDISSGTTTPFTTLTAGRDVQLASEGGKVLVETRYGSDNRLVSIDPLDQGVIELVKTEAGKRSLFSVSQQGERIAFISEDLDRPPELWVRDRQGALTCVTRENSALQDRRLYPGFDFRWQNNLGQWSTGYYFPAAGGRSGVAPPLALVMYGFDRQFTTWAQYISHYPVQWLCDRGMAVLLWNAATTPGWRTGDFEGAYRKEIVEPRASIDAAIDVLVELGLADSSRLGLMGHSMGGQWAGATIAHTQRFRAASIHEPAQRGVVAYWTNLTHFQYLLDGIFGGPPVGDNLRRYAQFCPELASPTPTCPVLVEAGSEYLPVLELFSAWKHGGTPIELVIYPEEPHVFGRPRNQVASTARNLDWFRFWLKDEEDSDPKKAEQYARWRKLRELHNADLKAMSAAAQKKN